MRLFIKNMVCPRCIQAVQQAAEFCEIKIRRIDLCELEAEEQKIEKIKELLS